MSHRRSIIQRICNVITDKIYASHEEAAPIRTRPKEMILIMKSIVEIFYANK